MRTLFLMCGRIILMIWAHSAWALLPMSFISTPSIAPMSAAQTQTLTYQIRNNVPTQHLPILSINVVNDNPVSQESNIFSVAHNCGSALQPYSTCTITVTINKPRKGVISAHLSVDYGGRVPLTNPISLSIKAAYTILIYMVGSDLESAHNFATKNIQQMLSINSASNMNIVLETGGANAPGWTTVKRSLVVPKRLLELKDLGLINMAAPSTIQDFIEWGMTTFPANKYILIFWDHGGGPNGGFGGDEAYSKPAQTTPVNQIVGVISNVNNQLHKTFEIIGFDACLMASSEIVSGLQPYTNYFVASEDLEPGNGWQYNTFLNYVNANPNANGLSIGTEIVDGYTEANEGSSTTLSVIETASVPALVEAIGDFAAAISTHLTSVSDWKNIARGRLASADYSTFIWDNLDTDIVDLYNLATNMPTYLPYSDVSTTATAVMSALTNTVKYYQNSANRQSSHGAAIYFPSILPSYVAQYPSNTYLDGSSFFSQMYTNFITYYHAFYIVNRTSLVASPSTPVYNSGTTNYTATVSNDYDDLYAVVGNTNCTNLYNNELKKPLTSGPCYSSLQYEGIISTSAGGNTWDISFNKTTYSGSWPYVNDQPVLLIPSDTEPGIPNSNFIIPVNLVGNNLQGPTQSGYLVVTLISGTYQIIGFQPNVGSENTESKVYPIKDGNQFYIRNYATLNGTNWALYMTDKLITAPLALNFNSVPTSSAPQIYNSFRFLVGDLTGALNISPSDAVYN